MPPPPPGQGGDRQRKQRIAEPSGDADEPRDALAQAPQGVQGIDQQVGGGGLRVRMVPESPEREVPGEEGNRRGDKPQQLPSPLRRQQQLDYRGDRENDPGAGKGERNDHERGGHGGAPPAACLQGQQPTEAAGHRSQPTHLECPQKVFPAHPDDQK